MEEVSTTDTLPILLRASHPSLSLVSHSQQIDEDFYFAPAELEIVLLSDRSLVGPIVVAVSIAMIVALVCSFSDNDAPTHLSRMPRRDQRKGTTMHKTTQIYSFL
jgi:hypothetical protein